MLTTCPGFGSGFSPRPTCEKQMMPNRVILGPFLKFPEEAAIIGRLSAGHTMLELDLMNCVQVVRDDLDAILKAMFRVRGETARIDIADALGRHFYDDRGLGTEFAMAIGAVRHCLKIRNQYAHCIWYDDYSGKLAFSNIEESPRIIMLGSQMCETSQS
jgi:hypothetical protein